MSSKAERSATLARDRAKKHREKIKRLKLDPSVSKAEASSLCGEIVNSVPESQLSLCGEDVNSVLEIQPVGSDPTIVIQDQDSSVSLENNANLLISHDIQIRESSKTLSDCESSDDENRSKQLSVSNLEDNRVIRRDLFGRLRQWASKNVTYYKVRELLLILHDFHPEIPLSTQTLLKTDLNLHNQIRKFNVCDPSDKSEYVYFGIAIHLVKIVNPSLHIFNILELIMNVDGMTPWDFSPLNFWPILGLVYHQSSTYKPFVISAYFGRGKPFSVDLYLEDFITELNFLCKHGIIIKDKKFEIRVKCFCCDRPARSFLKCVMNHGAYYACERCWVAGLQYMGRMVYPLREYQQRTDESFRNHEEGDHHDGISPLKQLRDKDNKPLKFITLFVQEFMHAGYLENMKKLMTEQWFSDDNQLTRNNKVKISLKLVNLAGQIPLELGRFDPKDLKELGVWKAKDYRLMLQYIGPLILKGVLPDEQYSHFLLFHVATRILSSRDLMDKLGSQAKIYLDRFVLLSELIYGLEFVVLNPHTLSHVSEDVKNMSCPLGEIDAFIFEGYLSELKHALRSGNRPLAQMCRKVETDFEFHHKEAVSTSTLRIYDHKEIKNFFHIGKLRYLSFILTPKSPNNVLFMTDGSVVKICDIICSQMDVDASKVYILGEKLNIIGSAFNYPIPPSALHIYTVERSHQKEIVKYPLSTMHCKMMLCEIYELSCDEKEIFVVPLLPMLAS
ncbi:hypothetical protein QAD02_007070 [Eretmocerus hayati]|uniref:Uncharacterized protein n=1 Tax=Eretmocerus hayati TaxID=131215 RepID=A0ACC2N2N8_9HYME|nr:hypothetical protein QAD02_007070 [Eretmocerus hayati]